MDVQKAISFIHENRTELEKYRLNYLLGKERDDEVPLRYLRGLQNDDGGFPYEDGTAKVSCMLKTSANLSLMIELGLTESDVCRKAVGTFLRFKMKKAAGTKMTKSNNTTRHSGMLQETQKPRCGSPQTCATI